MSPTNDRPEKDGTDDSTADSTKVSTTKPAAKPTGTGTRPSPAASAASRARRIGGSVAASRTTRTPTAAGKPAAAATSEPAQATPPAESTTPTAPTAPTTKLAKLSKPAKIADETVPAEKDAKPSRPLPPWAVWTPPVVFLAIAAVFIVLIVAARSGDTPSAPTAKQRDVVLAATKNCVAATNTYRYTDIDKYEKAGLACATGRYAKNYRHAIETVIKKNAPTQKFTQLAQVNTAGVEAVSGDGKQWTVLVYGQLNITNTATGKNGRVDPFGVVAFMQQAKGAWVIADIKLLSPPTG